MVCTKSHVPRMGNLPFSRRLTFTRTWLSLFATANVHVLSRCLLRFVLGLKGVWHMDEPIMFVASSKVALRQAVAEDKASTLLLR